MLGKERDRHAKGIQIELMGASGLGQHDARESTRLQGEWEEAVGDTTWIYNLIIYKIFINQLSCLYICVAVSVYLFWRMNSTHGQVVRMPGPFRSLDGCSNYSKHK